MSGDRRREAILQAALPLFAELGLRGVTTKQIADASGVSEALLYKHFHSKEDLYSELQHYCVRSATRRAQLDQLTPSTSTLVIGLYWLFRYILIGGEEGSAHNRHIRRLIITSALEDGGFARGFMKKNTEPLFQLLSQCIPVARASGDLADDVDPTMSHLWIAHGLAAGVALFENADPPIVAYGLAQEQLLAETVRFALRGLGVRPEAIQRHLNAEAFTLLNSK